MSIDIIYIILIAMAVLKGYSRGLIVAIFSLLAIIIGLAAAMKFSVLVTGWLALNTHIGTQWLPFIAFIAIFILIVIIVRSVANLIEAAIDMALLSWINKLAGIILYVLLYSMVYSIVLFYGTQMGIISQTTIGASTIYGFIEPWGPTVINLLGSIIPVFKDMFQQLEQFFGNVSSQAV
ncbi:CvpA family protein [Limnovirga soli]|uniref:CvpA family protein n=1 Tax=Limnovirga soli TaxID=2656915 RepID=A0A8J8JTM6_9BACT|nr:CvpA family protein [Limnovirga soli]NNV55355.1 CvpA family protein [Limnovirga soli]